MHIYYKIIYENIYEKAAQHFFANFIL